MTSSDETFNKPAPIEHWRHRWIPIAIVAAASGWWLWQSLQSRYRTFEQVIVVLLSMVALSAWFLICGGVSRTVRILAVGALWLSVAAFFTVVEPVYNGAMGIARWEWRYANEADQQLQQIESASVAENWQTTPHDYPRFLGNGYWAEVKGVQLERDWEKNPPRELWRREIGGGWSSFAVVGDYAVTQEQRGENELVSCYRLRTGEPVWTHADKARFDPADFQGSLGDIGPRATPTIVGERIYTQGGTGIVNCLDARTGDVIWSRNTAEEFGVPVTTWGKSGSPLIVADMVVISVGTADENAVNAGEEREEGISSANCSLVAFDIETGETRWASGTRRAAYSSPVAAELAGEKQILVVNQSWVTAHRAKDGEVLWEHPWEDETDGNASVSQPVPLVGDRVFLSKGYGTGASLLAIRRSDDGKLVTKPLWKPAIKKVMKTKFSNVVIRDGFVYGLDDVLLSCIELETGKLKWKKRRDPEFGYGQIILIGDVILVLSESGEVVLVEASPEEYRELASMQALADSNVTWNNPVFALPYLLVRNAREASCYELPVVK
jgi:outer membrane protein assembly factor BamB